jgi:hypothetical protein
VPTTHMVAPARLVVAARVYVVPLLEPEETMNEGLRSRSRTPSSAWAPAAPRTRRAVAVAGATTRMARRAAVVIPLAAPVRVEIAMARLGGLVAILLAVRLAVGIAMARLGELVVTLWDLRHALEMWVANDEG